MDPVCVELYGIRVMRRRNTINDIAKNNIRTKSSTNLNSGNNSRSKYLLHPHNITLGSITHKYLTILNDAIVQLIRNLGPQITHALLGTVSTISFLGTKFGGRVDETGEDVIGDGLSGVTDAKRDDAGCHFGVFGKVGVATTTDFGEELLRCCLCSSHYDDRKC